MKMYVYLPVAIHPAPRKALLISYGCGVTAKALTDTAEFRQIDVVDISKDILDLSSVVYPEPSEHPLNDPRVTVFIEDGRFFLLTTSERYDLITGEPPPPKGAHIVNLYTREYFQLIHDRLAPGGMTTYWLPQDSLSHDDARGIMRAFCDVFENCSLWLGGGQNWMLVGIREGHRPVSEERFRRQWNDATVRPILQASGFETPEQMGSFYIADTKFLRELLRDDLPLVDNFPHRLSPTSSVLKPERQYAELLSPDAARQRFLDSELIDQLWPAPIREETAPYFDQRCFIHDLWSADRFRMSGIRVGSLAGVDHLMSANLETAVLWALASGYREQRIAERVAGELPDHPIVRFKLGHGALARRDLTKAVEHYERLQNSERQSYHARRTALLCVYALCLDNRVEEARPMLDRWLHGEDLDPDQQADLEFLLTRFELLIPEKAAADSTTEP